MYNVIFWQHTPPAAPTSTEHGLRGLTSNNDVSAARLSCALSIAFLLFPGAAEGKRAAAAAHAPGRPPRHFNDRVTRRCRISLTKLYTSSSRTLATSTHTAHASYTRIRMTPRVGCLQSGLTNSYAVAFNSLPVYFLSPYFSIKRSEFAINVGVYTAITDKNTYRICLTAPVCLIFLL